MTNQALAWPWGRDFPLRNTRGVGRWYWTWMSLGVSWPAGCWRCWVIGTLKSPIGVEFIHLNSHNSRTATWSCGTIGNKLLGTWTAALLTTQWAFDDPVVSGCDILCIPLARMPQSLLGQISKETLVHCHCQPFAPPGLGPQCGLPRKPEGSQLLYQCWGRILTSTWSWRMEIPRSDSEKMWQAVGWWAGQTIFLPENPQQLRGAFSKLSWECKFTSIWQLRTNMGLTFVEGFEQGAASGFGEVRLGSAGSVEGEGVRPPLSKASTEQVWLRCRANSKEQGPERTRGPLQEDGINDHYSRHRMICNRGWLNKPQ